MKIEIWNGYNIRFVEKNGEWWAVAKDVAVALGYKHTPHMIDRINITDKGTVRLTDRTPGGGNPNVSIISEFGIYDAVFGSHKKEAKEFKRWVFNVLKQLRQATGLEGFQIFRMLDKDHQKEAMSKLNKSLDKPVRVDFIKANTISNKAVSTKYGYPKMIKKGDMSPDMLVDRQSILDDTVELMAVKDKYGLDMSVSREIYRIIEGKCGTA